MKDHIDPSLTVVNYTSFDDTVEMVLSLGTGALMAKADIKFAFRLLPVQPDDCWASFSMVLITMPIVCPWVVPYRV